MQVKVEVHWPSGQVKLASVVLDENSNFINDNFQSEAISKLKASRLVTCNLKVESMD